MIIRNLNVIGVTVDKAEADAPLVVDGDGMLPLAVSGELVKPVARRSTQIIQARCQIDVLQLSPRPPHDLRGKPLGTTGDEQIPCPPVRKCFDHTAEYIVSRDSCRSRGKLAEAGRQAPPFPVPGFDQTSSSPSHGSRPAAGCSTTGWRCRLVRPCLRDAAARCWTSQRWHLRCSPVSNPSRPPPAGPTESPPAAVVQRQGARRPQRSPASEIPRGSTYHCTMCRR